MKDKDNFKEFKPTSWSIDNKTSIYVLAFIIAVFGLINYNSIPKEQIPEIVIPTILVSSVYPGTAPTDMENIVTRPLEKNIKSISGVKKITSNSVQDFSMIAVEFTPDIDIKDAKQKVKDAVDKSKKDLPNDPMFIQPDVIEIDLSEIPIMYINLAGDYDLAQLKKYAELAQDKIESLKEITRVDIVGALDREIQIDMDMFKMHAVKATLGDVERAIASENISIAGGSIDIKGMRRSIRIVGEFTNVEQIKNLVINASSGAHVKLSEIAEVKDSFKEQESFARLNGKNVVTLNVIKKSGQNLLDASDQIKAILKDLQKDKFPEDMSVYVNGDQSKFTRTTLFDLNNTIIIGFILVTIILTFFMGLTNAIFVGLSVPLSMALVYIVLPGIDFTMNMLVMFAFIFALGIVVDDAIVVIENTHRIFKKTRRNITESAKIAAGEVFVPILSGTLTTLAPFFPLAFWPGVVGKFMLFIPVTLILVLFASLLVAYIINPVFAVSFMKLDEEESRSKRSIYRNGIILLIVGLLFHLISWHGMGNLAFFIGIVYVGHNLWGYRAVKHFQKVTLPNIMNSYERLLRWSIRNRNPYRLLYGMIGLLFLTFIITGIAKPKVVFFPDNEPNAVWVYLKMPVGTDVKTTDSVTRIIENRIYEIIGKDNPLIESIQTNVARGASTSIFDNTTITSHRSKISLNFVEFAERHGKSTNALMEQVREGLKDIKCGEISVEKNHMGPPTGKPINIEISGDDYDELDAISKQLIQFLNSKNIAGIEELKSDIDITKPEIVIDIDRERANREGISTGQIGSEIRTAILGKEVSKFREGEEQYPIQLRYDEQQRTNINRLLNLKITYRDMNTGILRQIPLSAVAKVDYRNTYGGINRKNLKRLITVSSSLITGYTANEIVAQINAALPSFSKPENVDIKLTGEQEDQKESTDFLGKAMLLSLFLILFILITQFNSLSKPIIILSEVLFSIIGVLLGYIIFNMTISIVMTGMGIVALAGIVVRNGILLVEFTDVLKAKGMKTRDAIVEAGKTRITPVLLTTLSTILGLVPLAVGFNIDFIGLFQSFSPNIHFGGDNVMFFGPLSWSIIFGLTFAAFLTLVIIPVMYYVMYAGKAIVQRKKSNIVYKRNNRG